MKSEKDYDVLRYSQKDVYAIIAKIMVFVVFAVLAYARFLNTENNQKQIKSDIKVLDKKVDDNNAQMYRHVAEKEREIEGRLDRKAGRNEKTLRN